MNDNNSNTTPPMVSTQSNQNTNNSNHSSNFSFPMEPDENEKARSELISALIPDLPLLMHGSGDVEPSLVSPTTTAYLAELTANYIRDLVEAAVDAHDILIDGSSAGILPPLSPNHHHHHSGGEKEEGDGREYKDNLNISNSKKRPRSKGSVWDDNHDLYGNTQQTNDSKGTSAVWKPTTTATSPYHRYPQTASIPPQTSNNNNNIYNKSNNAAGKMNTNPMDWVGLEGVDFYCNHRPKTRIKRPKSGLFIQTRSFLFPICHDKELYGKVKEIQSKRRQMLPELLDPSIMDVMKEECENNSNDASGSGSAADNSKNNSAVGEAGKDGIGGGAKGSSAAALNAAISVNGCDPTWPKANEILPVHWEDSE